MVFTPYVSMNPLSRVTDFLSRGITLFQGSVISVIRPQFQPDATSTVDDRTLGAVDNVNLLKQVRAGLNLLKQERASLESRRQDLRNLSSMLEACLDEVTVEREDVRERLEQLHHFETKLRLAKQQLQKQRTPTRDSRTRRRRSSRTRRKR